MEWSCPWRLITPGGTISFNTGSGDEYVLDPLRCSGDMPTQRLVVDPRPRTGGAILHGGLAGEWPFVLAGTMHCRTGTAAARNTMEANLKAALESIRAADGTLEQTPSGGSARTVTVRLQVPVGFQEAWVKTFVFGVVSGSTAWS